MDDEAKGIPYVSHYHVVGNPSREPVGDCYEQIMTDLNRAYEMLSVEAPDLSADLTASNSTAYISRATVDALRARVALYHGLYSQAYIYATNALRAVPIAKKDEVQNVWLDKSNAGVIFQLSRPAGSATIGTLFVGGDYSSIFRPSSDLREQYAETDIRASVFLEYGRDRAGSPVWMVKNGSATLRTSGVWMKDVPRRGDAAYCRRGPGPPRESRHDGGKPPAQRTARPAS